MSRPSISVVMPLLNGAPHVAEAVSSVVTQTVADVELIIVDDGSTDGGPDVVHTVAPDAIVITGPHLGTARARNLGVERAQGRYIAFLDADDVLPVDSLAIRRAALEQDPVRAAVFGRIEEFSSVGTEATPGRRRPARVTDARLLTTMLIRRDAFLSVGEFDGAAARWYNVDWFTRFDDSGLTWVQIPDVVVRRRLHDTNFGLSAGVQGDALLRTLRAALERRDAEPQS